MPVSRRPGSADQLRPARQSKQSHRRSKLQIVGIPEDLFDRASVHRIDKPGTLLKPRSKNGMFPVSFGFLATVLAAIGLYGVLAYVTAQRTREIGIRMALGAQRLAVMRLVLTDVLWLAGIAIVVTLPVAVLLSRTVRSQLYGVSPADPVVLIVGTLMIAAVAMLSALLPARRAATVEPMKALRTE